MNTIDILIGARARVARGWTQGAYARDAQGRELSCSWHPDTECMCAVGAILASRGRASEACAVDALLASILDQIPFQSDLPMTRIIRWNDAPSRTQADVLAAFDRAIAALQEEE